MVHLHRAQNGEFYMLIVGRNNRTIWQTETYKRRAGAYNAVLAAFDILNEGVGNEKQEKVVLNYIDHTRK